MTASPPPEDAIPRRQEALPRHALFSEPGRWAIGFTESTFGLKSSSDKIRDVMLAAVFAFAPLASRGGTTTSVALAAAGAKRAPRRARCDRKEL